MEIWFWISFSLSIILTIGTAIFNWQKDFYKATDNRDKIIANCLFISAVIGGILALGASIKSHLDSNDNLEKAELNAKEANYNDSLYKDLLEKNLSTSTSTLNSTDSALRNSRKILDSLTYLSLDQSKIISQQIESEKQTIGDKTPPRLLVKAQHSDQLIGVTFSILNEGKYPITDINVRIMDMCYDLTRAFIFTKEYLTKSITEMSNPKDLFGNSFSISSISPGENRFLYNSSCSQRAAKPAYRAFVSWHGGFYEYTIDYEIKNDKLILNSEQIKVKDKWLEAASFFKKNNKIK